jgi:hypothetical protein
MILTMAMTGRRMDLLRMAGQAVAGQVAAGRAVEGQVVAGLPTRVVTAGPPEARENFSAG